MLEWNEIKIQNKKMSSFGLVKLLKEADIVPGLVSPEHIGDIVVKITVSIVNGSTLSNLKRIWKKLTILKNQN